MTLMPEMITLRDILLFYKDKFWKKEVVLYYMSKIYILVL